MGKGNRHTYQTGKFITTEYHCACGRVFKFKNKKLVHRMINLHKTKCEHHKNNIDTGTGKFCKTVSEDYVYQKTNQRPNGVKVKQNVIKCNIIENTKADLMKNADLVRELHNKYFTNNYKNKRKKMVSKTL
jgi:hypothetical protein